MRWIICLLLTFSVSVSEVRAGEWFEGIQVTLYFEDRRSPDVELYMYSISGNLIMVEWSFHTGHTYMEYYWHVSYSKNDGVVDEAWTNATYYLMARTYGDGSSGRVRLIDKSKEDGVVIDWVHRKKPATCRRYYDKVPKIPKRP
ncbi:hypothetical protein AGMMS4957_01100 [Bacteroidia bacterium]|nr:hypothetical protein AGMMS4957_01100 [Bacteroidia bacterium]